MTFLPFHTHDRFCKKTPEIYDRGIQSLFAYPDDMDHSRCKLLVAVHPKQNPSLPFFAAPYLFLLRLPFSLEILARGLSHGGSHLLNIQLQLRMV